MNTMPKTTTAPSMAPPADEKHYHSHDDADEDTHNHLKDLRLPHTRAQRHPPARPPPAPAPPPRARRPLRPIGPRRAVYLHGRDADASMIPQGTLPTPGRCPLVLRSLPHPRFADCSFLFRFPALFHPPHPPPLPSAPLTPASP
ncbi:hypothetical protein C8J57DRAFT_1505382 [Mycena rebaudengoi]|nr:hypothetical protein C8J57DRAFT_1505382 [Mycena rebaudengoi]